MLGDIIGYLERREVAGLAEIAAALDTPPEAVQGMLDTLEKKGILARYQAPQGCGSPCRQCPGAELPLYCLASGRPAVATDPGSCRSRRQT